MFFLWHQHMQWKAQEKKEIKEVCTAFSFQFLPSLLMKYAQYYQTPLWSLG